MNCPECASGAQRLIGGIPDSRKFAGRELPAPLPGGQLWHCPHCHLRYRWPRLELPQLNALYEAGTEHNWTSDQSRRVDWVTAARWLLPVIPARAAVLDLGCFDGGFLDYLGDDYERYGVEIHPAARAAAEGKGIRVLGSDFEALEAADGQFDCVTAFDVIEHVAKPGEFLSRCGRLLKPGGFALIATGNADAVSFRMMKGAYWYCVIPEHISFISPAWCELAAERSELRVIRSRAFSHAAISRARFPVQLAANLTYRFLPGVYGRLQRLRGAAGGSSSELPAPPSWVTARDHFVMLFEKPS